MPTLDPFSQVYQRIIEIIKKDPTLKTLIRSGNLITFDGGISPIKKAAQPGDLPEILVEPVTGNDQWASTSTSAESTLVWSIKVATGQLQLFYNDAGNNPSGIFAVMWALMIAFDTASDPLASPNSSPALPALSFCRSSRITAKVQSPFDPAGNPISESRGTDGWTLLATLTTVLDLNRDANGVLVLPNG